MNFTLSENNEAWTIFSKMIDSYDRSISADQNMAESVCKILMGAALATNDEAMFNVASR